MLFVIWGLLSLSILITYDTLSFALGRKGWERFLSTFLFFYSHVILSEFILGLVSLLTSTSLLILNIVLLIGLALILRKRFGKEIFKNYQLSLRKSITAGCRSLTGDGLFIGLLVLAAVTVLWVVLLGVLFPVLDYDGNSYHMTFIANAIQNHNIYDVQTSLSWLKGYPKGGELVQMWNVMIPKNDMLADLAQVPFVILGIVAVYGMSLRIGVEKQTARFTSLLLLFLPVMINQAKSTYVDIIFNALFLAALAIVIKKRLSRVDLILLGIVYSLLISVKSTGLLLVAVTLPLLAFYLVDFRGRKLIYNTKQNLERIGLILLPMAFGLFWYVKDFILYKSPLYPFGLDAFGHSIFPGKSFQEFISTAFTNFSVMPHSHILRLWFVWTEQKDWFGCLYNYDATFSGLGPIWFIVLLPSVVVALTLAIRKKNYIFLGLALVLLITLAVYPADFYARYTIFIVALGILAYGLVANVLWRPVKIIMSLILLWLVYNVIGTTFTLCNYTPKAVREQLYEFRIGTPRDSALYSTTLGNSYSFLQHRIQPGEVVAYDSRPYYIYPLWRPDFANKVVYIPANDKNQWLKGIAKEKVRYILTNVKSKEHGWAEQSNLKSIYKDQVNEIYQAY